MSTALYRALIEANATEATAKEAAEQIDGYKQDVAGIDKRLAVIEAMVKAIVGLNTAILLLLVGQYIA